MYKYTVIQCLNYIKFGMDIRESVDTNRLTYYNYNIILKTTDSYKYMYVHVNAYASNEFWVKGLKV